MTKLTSFDKNNLANVRAAIDAALANVEKEFGITIQLGGIKYTAESIKATLEAVIADPLLEGLDPKYVQEILKYRDTKDLYKQETTIGGVKSIIVGMKPRTTGTQTVIRRSSDNSLRIVTTREARAGLTNQSLNNSRFGTLIQTPAPF